MERQLQSHHHALGTSMSQRPRITPRVKLLLLLPLLAQTAR
jgi:hypothetical protein